MSWLERILAAKRREIEALRELPRRERRTAPRPHGLRRAGGEPLRLLAEIKLRSPSAGALSTLLPPSARARAYEEAGAAAVSVLCDGPFFGGAPEHLAAARAAVSLPVLAKEFVLDEVQLDHLAAFEADLVLLIVRCLAPGAVRALVPAARRRGLEPLVEVVDEEEAAVALDAGAELIGVNARDLDTLRLDAARAARTIEALPASVVAIHLSGLASPRDVSAVRATAAHAALVGEALMRQDDPRALLRSLVSAARGDAAGPCPGT